MLLQLSLICRQVGDRVLRAQQKPKDRGGMDASVEDMTEFCATQSL